MSEVQHWKIGDLARYGEGSTALMRITDFIGGRAYGRGFHSSGTCTNRSIDALRQPDGDDLRRWADCHDADDCWIRGKWGDETPSPHPIARAGLDVGREYPNADLVRVRFFRDIDDRQRDTILLAVGIEEEVIDETFSQSHYRKLLDWAFDQGHLMAISAAIVALDAERLHRLSAPSHPRPDAEARARELLAAELLATGLELGAENVRDGIDEEIWSDVAIRAIAKALAPAERGAEWPSDAQFQLGEAVEKKGRSKWRGHIRGWYRTDLTALGYAIESMNEPGSVQVYPETAIRQLKGDTHE